MAQEGAFITGVDAGRPSSSSARRPKEEVLPARILSDNAKLTDVVDAFRSKVDLMVNKQKGEYEEAYALRGLLHYYSDQKFLIEFCFSGRTTWSSWATPGRP